MKHSTRKKQAWADRVLKDIERQLEREKQKKRKQKKKDVFAKIDKNRTDVQFKSKNKLSMIKHFYMLKLRPDFHYVSRNALAVYPVICSKADFRNDTVWRQLCRENIGKLAGIGLNAVDKATEELTKINLTVGNKESEIRTPFLRRRKQVVNGALMWHYLPGFFRYGVKGLDPKEWEGQCFAFYTSIIEHGIWAGLSRKAKALYIAMRSKAFFDQQAYNEIEGVWIPDYEDMDSEEWQELDDTDIDKYNARKWDVCNSSLKELFALAGMSYTGTKQLTNELEDAGLIDKPLPSKSIFVVYRKPRIFRKTYM